MHAMLKAPLTCPRRVRGGKSSSGNSHLGGVWCLVSGVTLRYARRIGRRRANVRVVYVDGTKDSPVGRSAEQQIFNCVRSMAGREVQGVVVDTWQGDMGERVMCPK